MSELRTPLIVVEPVSEGAAALRAALALVEPVANGPARLLAALAMVEPVANGPVGVRCAISLVETVIQVPEELPVATAVFPTLKGLTWPITKNPEFSTAVRQATSGKETRTAYRPYPIWHFELPFDYLPDDKAFSGYQQSDYRTLEGFFLARIGKAQAWLFRDQDDYHVVGGPIAIGDAVTLQWAFARQFSADEPDYLEPVGQVDLSTILSFPASAVNTTTDAIAVTSHGLTTGQGPLFVSNTGGSLPTGLTAGTPYWAIEVDVDHFQLATNQPNALASTAIDLTGAGSGTNTLTKGWAVYEGITEAATVPGVGPFTVTVAHASTFVADAGVTISGVALSKVASSPAANQYAVSSTGVYTFNSAQASASAEISYSYLATNVTLTLPNQLVFAAAPASGTIITADFDFWFVCRFEEDTTELKQFASKFWDLDKITFQSVLQ